jgi:hypothetical protein
LNGILKDVIPILNKEGKLWVAYPKTASKIASDLNRDSNWEILTSNNFVSVCEVILDHVWSALRFEKVDAVKTEEPEVEKVSDSKKVELKGVDFVKNLVVPPAELEKMFTGHKKAREFFQNLSETNQQEFVEWIEGAKRQDTKTRRLEATVEKLLAGKKSPQEK